MSVWVGGSGKAMVGASSQDDQAPGPAFTEAWRQRVEALVRSDRFEHIERVTALALEIGRSNGFSASELEQVELAGMLHDAARDLPEDELLRLAPPEYEVEVRHPLAVHGRAAVALARSWGVTDPVVLGAIEGHVWGVDPSDRIGMAVYVADVSEPARGVNADIRHLAMTDLSAAYRQAVASKVHYLEGAGIEVHPTTRKTYEALHEAS